MSRGYGLHKSQTAIQKETMLYDYKRYCKWAREAGRPDLIERYPIDWTWGYRKIDKVMTPFGHELIAIGALGGVKHD
jgi:hypothetical protein